MFSARLKRIATAIVILSIAALLAGCGKSEPVENRGGTPGGQPAPYSGGGCVPLGQPISFTANNMYFYQPGSSGEIAVGQIPQNNQSFLPIPAKFAGRNIGQIYVDPNVHAVQNPYGSQGGPGMTYEGYSPKGYVRMTITPTSGSPTQAGTANAAGEIQTYIQTYSSPYTGGYGGYQQPYNPYSSPYGSPYGGSPYGGSPYGAPAPVQPQDQVCGLAIVLNIREGNRLYLGNIYLYTNNSGNGKVIEFTGAL